MDKIIGFIQDAGPAAWIIITLGLIATAIVIERARKLFLEVKLKSESYVLQIESHILSHRLDQALALCAADIKQPMSKVIHSILERADRDEKSMAQAQQLKLGEALAPLSDRLGYLMMIANVATLVGLLGTISGLIMSFEAVSFAEPAQKQILLSQGISLAMNTTALGLMVAIPVMLAYAILNGRQNKLSDQMVTFSGRVFDLLTNRHYMAVPNEQNNVAHISQGNANQAGNNGSAGNEPELIQPLKAA